MFNAGRITFNEKTGRYHSEFGGFLSKADIKGVIREERGQLEGKLLSLVDQYERGKIGRVALQTKAAQEFKYANLRSITIGAGGQDALQRNRYNSFYFEEARKDLRSINDRFNKMLDRHEKGDLTIGQIRGWVKYRSNSVFQAYHKSEQMTQIGVQGVNEAWRSLGGNIDHCSACPGFVTGGWVPIESVVPVGSNCPCGGRCKCKVRVRFNPVRALEDLGNVSLIKKVNDLRNSTTLS